MQFTHVASAALGTEGTRLWQQGVTGAATALPTVRWAGMGRDTGAQRRGQGIGQCPNFLKISCC